MPQTSGAESNLQGTVRTYPIGIDEIPYASYFKITKYKYQAGLEAAGNDKRQNDVLGGIGRNSAAKALAAGLRGAGEFLFNGQNGLTRATEDVLLKQALKEKQTDKYKGASKTRHSGKPVAEDYSNVKFPITTADGRTFENAAQLIDLKKQAKMAEDAKFSICKLPLPNEFQYSYDASWSNEFKLGTMARFLEDGQGAFGQMLATGALKAGADALGQLTGGALNTFSKGITDAIGVDFNVNNVLQNGIQGATNPLGVNSQLTPTNLLGLGGLAPNENAIMMFSRMQMRSFDVTFELFARDDTEAGEIDAIVQWFKTGMHPTATVQGTGGVLGFPDVFVLEPEFVPVNAESGEKKKPVRHPQMPKTKLCALSRMSVNTTPANSFLTTYTGEIPLQTISLTFNELTALTQSDLEVGHF
mgnify:CR=1 FL=1|tara:strand:+ start:433 stop:1680 length:1248 start_codon:yes stop_codon:yes gene_type:complete